jgi:hypothetical protein
MKLLNNAVVSIHLALEDYDSTGNGRMLSAVRNLHAGILLLFKEKLRRASPPGSGEILLMAKSEFQKSATGAVISVGIGRKTVDVKQIRERFENLGIKTDWKRFDEINRLRNDIEHYFTVVNPATMRAMISNTFIIIRNFISEELDFDPQEELGEMVWKKMLSVSEVAEKEREECKKALDAIWNRKHLPKPFPTCGVRSAVRRFYCQPKTRAAQISDAGLVARKKILNIMPREHWWNILHPTTIIQ